MKLFGQIILGLLVLVLLIGLAFVFELGGLEWKKFFAPKHAAVEREVFKETKSYNESKLQDLARYRLQYLKADGSDREALASTIRHMYADYDRNKLPAELASFLYKVRGY